MAQLNEQFLRMQKLAGIITEEQYSEKIEEVSISGTLGKIKDKILNLPVFGKLIDTLVSKMSKEDIEKFKAKFNLNEAEGGPSLEDIFAKVNSANPDKDVKEPENLKEELDPDSFQGKVVNLVRNLTGLNLLALGGAPLGMLLAAVLGFPGIGLLAGALISLVATLIIHGISRKLLGMSSDDAIVGEAKNLQEAEKTIQAYGPRLIDGLKKSGFDVKFTTNSAEEKPLQKIAQQSEPDKKLAVVYYDAPVKYISVTTNNKNQDEAFKVVDSPFVKEALPDDYSYNKQGAYFIEIQGK